MTNKTRELRQLWYAAKMYGQLSEKIVQQGFSLESSLTELSNRFNSEIPEDAPLTDLFIHLSSAAVRTSTAYDILDGGQSQQNYRDIMKNTQLTEQQKKVQIGANLAKHIMHMLRDNIGHVEPNDFWKLRQDYLGPKNVSEIYDAFNKSMTDLEQRLKTRGIL